MNQSKDKTCIFSPDRLYRYTLWREWDLDDLLSGGRGNEPIPNRYLMVIGLNPSTADETKDDPTIRRCIDFAKRWGYGALCMTNLFAWRDTDPAKMKRAAKPIGPLNDQYLAASAMNAGMVLAAWGANGSFNNRDSDVLHRLKKDVDVELWCLGYNADGSPKHPLYCPAASKVLAWPEAKASKEVGAAGGI